MAYKKRVYRFRNAIEIEEYHSFRYGAPGTARQKRKKPTPEQMAKINQKNKARTCRHKLRTHFDVNDYFVDLTYAKENRPADMAQAKREFRECIEAVRKEYRARGVSLKWIRNIEVGKRNAWHVHLVLNRIRDTDLILRSAWPHGRVVCQLLHEKGEFRALADYITKTPDTDPRLVEASYSSSRNLPVKDPEETVTQRWATWKDEIMLPWQLERAGWYVDRDSVEEGINPITLQPYRHYTLLRDRRKSNAKKRQYRRADVDG